MLSAKIVILLLLFWTSSSFSQASPKFFESHVIRRERVENTVFDDESTTKIQMEYLILRDHSLWVREISLHDNVRHLPKLISLGAYASQDLILFDEHLFVVVAYPAFPFDQYLMELNIQKPIASPRKGYFAGAIANSMVSGISSYFMLNSFNNGQHIVGSIQALLTAYFVYQASYGCYEAMTCHEPSGLFNQLVVSERGEPLRIDNIIYHPINFLVQDVRLTTPARENPIFLSHWLSNNNCRSGLSLADAPSAAL